ERRGGGHAGKAVRVVGRGLLPDEPAVIRSPMLGRRNRIIALLTGYVVSGQRELRAGREMPAIALRIDFAVGSLLFLHPQLGEIFTRLLVEIAARIVEDFVWSAGRNVEECILRRLQVFRRRLEIVIALGPQAGTKLVARLPCG